MFSLILLSILISSVSSSTQSVGAQGQLMCGNSPLANTQVTLWELHDLPEPDFQLATVNTDSNGYFSVSGSDSTTFTMKPAVRIYHNCNNDGVLGLPSLCQREVTYQIPSSYVTTGSSVNNWYQMGTLNMQAKQPNEQSHCASNPIRTVLEFFAMTIFLPVLPLSAPHVPMVVFAVDTSSPFLLVNHDDNLFRVPNPYHSGVPTNYVILTPQEQQPPQPPVKQEETQETKRHIRSIDASVQTNVSSTRKTRRRRKKTAWYAGPITRSIAKRRRGRTGPI